YRIDRDWGWRVRPSQVHAFRSGGAVAAATDLREEGRGGQLSVVVAGKDGAAHDLTEIAAAGVLRQRGNHRAGVHAVPTGQAGDERVQDAGGVGAGGIADFDDGVETSGADRGLVQGDGVVGRGEGENAGFGGDVHGLQQLREPSSTAVSVATPQINV